MLDFLALLIAIAALIFARKSFNQVATLRARLDAFESAAPQAKPLSAPPPLPTAQTAAPDASTPPPIPAEPPPLAAEPAIPILDSPDIGSAPGDNGATPPPLPLPGRHRASKSRSAPAGWCGSVA
jgi:hypothetical protein